MSSEVKVALAGIAGYGDRYLEALLPRQHALGARLVGVVDPQPQRCARLRELHDQKIPIHPSMQSLLANDGVDLMLIVTPIHLHAGQTCMALSHGASVLCEKPVAGTLTDAVRMAETQATVKGFAAIGFQWSFSQTIQSLKHDVMSGLLGRPVRLKSIALIPRPMSYFTRNDWAGKMFSADGEGIFDSPVNNAAAHFLHNMFYILGSSRETSAVPASVQAELYRANDIENYDTAAIRCHTRCGAEVLFYTSHACHERRGPRSRYEFENAIVEYDAMGTGKFVARFHDGRVKHYGHPNLDRHEKIWQSIESVRTGEPIACGIPAAMAHAACVAAAQESPVNIAEFPQRLRRIVPLDGEAMVAIDRLGEQMTDCYERDLLPSEHPEVVWGRSANVIDVARATAPRRPCVAVSVHATAPVSAPLPSGELH